MSSTVIVIPCYNEASRLPVATLAEFADRHNTIRFMLVDDGSTDGTPEIISDLVRRSPRSFGSLMLERNCGKAEAVRRGVRWALEQEGRMQHFGYWDADLSTPLEEIPRFIARLEQMPQVVMVTGARIKMLGRSIERRLLRHYGGRAFATLVTLLLGIEMYDTQCGAKLFRVAPEIEHLFVEPFCSRWLFDLEILLRLRMSGNAKVPRSLEDLVYEHPLNEWRDVAGSKISPYYFVWSFFDLLKVRRYYQVPA